MNSQFCLFPSLPLHLPHPTILNYVNRREDPILDLTDVIIFEEGEISVEFVRPIATESDLVCVDNE